VEPFCQNIDTYSTISIQDKPKTNVTGDQIMGAMLLEWHARSPAGVIPILKCLDKKKGAFDGILGLILGIVRWKIRNVESNFSVVGRKACPFPHGTSIWLRKISSRLT
jgi:hypothetical protein